MSIQSQDEQGKDLHLTITNFYEVVNILFKRVAFFKISWDILSSSKYQNNVIATGTIREMIVSFYIALRNGVDLSGQPDKPNKQSETYYFAFIHI